MNKTTLQNLIYFLLIALFYIPLSCTSSQNPQFFNTDSVRLVPLDTGWAQNSVNTVIFRQNSVTSFDSTQFASYYDSTGHVVLAKRKLGSLEWEFNRTPFSGYIQNTHNAISIGIDGDGFLHMVWDMHNEPLRYVKSTRPGSLNLTEPLKMTGKNESVMTYPQFYRLPDGDLLFSYRAGGSGDGNVMLNRYITETQTWQPVQHPIIDGEGLRNAYTNPVAVDHNGGWHLSWNWRDSPDVASNHDLAYAYSPDNGESWFTSKGNEYSLPITYENAEVIRRIPKNSELINQTSMTINNKGEPIIATYWRPENNDTPQYYLIWHNTVNNQWQTRQISNRSTVFSLSGLHTRRIPLSRPLVVSDEENAVYVIFRDFERGGSISIAASFPSEYKDWQFSELDSSNVGLWEPTYDPVVWNEFSHLHLFRQRVGQGDAESLEDIDPQEISILEWNPDSMKE